MDSFIKRSWVEIDLSQIQENYRLYKLNLSPEASVMAVIKANAYGHGDIEVASSLEKVGVNCWAVSNIEEAYKLRKSGIKGDILILGYTPIEAIPLLEKYDITQAVLSEEYANILQEKRSKAKCQIAIDTGMNRIGLDADDSEKCIKTIHHLSNTLNINGIFTHLCVADGNRHEDNEFTKSQIEKFELIADAVQDLRLKNIHCLNSAGGLWNDTKYNSLVRLGIILYGLKPDANNVLPAGIKPAMKWKSALSMVKTVKSGESIGYGRSFTAKTDMRIATVSTGYADGYSRKLSNMGYVFVNEKKAKIVGRICMDQFMIDVTNIPEAKIGMEAQLLSDNYSADDMAQDIGTIGYEIVCGISSRVTRVYL